MCINYEDKMHIYQRALLFLDNAMLENIDWVLYICFLPKKESK